jgi:tyrosyl-tRNA synthetase
MISVVKTEEERCLKTEINEYIESILQILSAGAVEVLPLEVLRTKLLENRPLKIKLGADPTSPNIHLGHLVVLEKLHDFQKLGHEIIFLIGDFTARIGDPTGKSKTRPPLSEQEVIQNTKTYINQISRVIDIEKTKIVYNNDWFCKFKGIDWIKMCSSMTVAQIIQREDFANRLNNNTPIGLHELLYPLLQGYDSVVLEADVEIGGTDQKFNMLMGRQLQELKKKEGQVIITMPLIEGLDGVMKMSKSLKNEIALQDTAQHAFMKIMSISDALMINYFKHILRYTNNEIDHLVASCGPIEAKKKLAQAIIARYWSVSDSEKSYIYFTDVVQNKKYDSSLLKKLFLDKKEYNIIDLIIYSDSSLSRSAARRLLFGGAVSINNTKIIDDKYTYLLNESGQDILKIGKQILFLLCMST